MKARRWLRRLATLLGVLLLLCLAVGRALWIRQGLMDDDWGAYRGARVQLDAYGVPTITASTWSAAWEAQGYVTAANRLFQMDLMRRSAGGGLAALFGPGAVPHDTKQRAEDWQGQARWLAEQLPPDEKRACERYTTGVNRFIEDRPWGWGLEYLALRQRPEPWTCSDTMLIYLAMADDLSGSAKEEPSRAMWRAALPAAWDSFLFPFEDPWNVPLFGEVGPPAALPPPLNGAAPASAEQPPAPPISGSNNWAWRGKTGTFLANDPHLGLSVPQLWFLVRLRVHPERGDDEWVAGASIPGCPGVVLGMNQNLAWAFTNTSEDVDDLLIEQVSADGETYLAGYDSAGNERWESVERRAFTIQVAGGDAVAGVGLFTRRGPLSYNANLGLWLSRQWLPLRRDPSLARIAAVQVNRARDLDELDTALDGFGFPAQNVVAATRDGAIAYRTSGTGVVRTLAGDVPQPAIEGEWRGLQPSNTRPRLRHSADDPGPVWIATANQRIWTPTWNQGWDEGWGNDRRASRIRDVLASKDDFTRVDMEALQLDTGSRTHQVLAAWALARHAPADETEKLAMARWAAWDGIAAHDTQTFTELLALESGLEGALLDAVRAAFPASAKLPYSWRLDGAMTLAVLGVDSADGLQPDPTSLFVRGDECTAGFSAFGLDEQQVAALVVAAAVQPRSLYTESNHMAAQHPFVGRVPLLGDWLRIPEPPQLGHGGLIRSEEPRHGASIRLVWDLKHPASSTWVSPVGQSGHLRSPHYFDLQKLYYSDVRLPVLDDGGDWN